MAQKGFNYLNSKSFIDYIEKKEDLERNNIESYQHKVKLLNIYNLFHTELKDKRENSMLQNIYNFSKENQFNQAVFLIGAEHKRTLLQKIKEFDKISEIKVNFKFYNYE